MNAYFGQSCAPMAKAAFTVQIFSLNPPQAKVVLAMAAAMVNAYKQYLQSSKSDNA
jgi:hypothetical protein